MPVTIPEIRPITVHFMDVFLAELIFPRAISSATIFMQVIFKPAEAKVIPNIYVVIISPKTPSASDDILLEIYILNIIFISCKTKELLSTIVKLIKNVFNLFKDITF